MSKQQVIEQIQQRNRTAKSEFLATFDEVALQSYLRRLTTVVGQRGRTSVWVRENNAPVTVSRHA